MAQIQPGNELPINSRGPSQDAALSLSVSRPLDSEAQFDMTDCLWTIDNVVLTTRTINDLYKLYFTNYHPFFPLLDAEIFHSPRTLLTASPLLFWLVIGLPARYYGDDPTIHFRLDPILRARITNAICTVPNSLLTLQALLISCVWPFSTSSLWSDPTWMICGLIMNVGLHMGLHHPANLKDFERVAVMLDDRGVRERAKTWACCLAVSQMTATSLGLMSQQLFGTAQWEALLPPELVTIYKIEQFCFKVSSLGLERMENPATVINILELELEDLRTTPMSLVEEFFRCAAKIHLLNFYLFDTSPTPNHLALWNVYSASRSFLEQWGYHADYFTAAPDYFYRVFSWATIVLIRFLHSSFLTNSKLNLQAEQPLFFEAIKLIKSRSVDPNDLPDRGHMLLTQCWESYESEQPVDLRLKVRTRLSASIYFDQMWDWRYRYSGRDVNVASKRSNNGNTATGTESQLRISFEDQYAQLLSSFEFDPGVLDPDNVFGIDLGV